ncbi:hypothetical protein OIO90_001085 [Microbotryomycetes sp. JL221]|nr:hypothetical protein OIO90_001085 [Microbotryomycetes sp. JL221]
MSMPRYLLTVIPPSHLPHDPPHPKVNPNCSGYGPPEHFKRGTLVPLQPTLSSQLAVIAREYSLPSTGGLLLFLLSTNDPSPASLTPLPGASGLEGGPRIGEEAWSMLWSSFFEDEVDSLAFEEEPLTEDEEEYPPVPPIPASHRQDQPSEARDARTFGEIDRRVHRQQNQLAEGEGLSSDGAEELASGSSDFANGDLEGTIHQLPARENGRQDGAKLSSSSKHFAGPSIGRGLPSGLPSPGPSRRGSVPARLSSFSHPNLRHASQPNSASRPRHTSYGPSIRSFSGFGYGAPAAPVFGPPVIVGRVEFDIDRRKGGKARWYESWLESANANSSVSAAPTPLTLSNSRFASDQINNTAPTIPQHVKGVEQLPASPQQQEKPHHTQPSLPVPKPDLSWNGTELRSIDQSLTPTRGLRPLELSRNASPVIQDSEKAQETMSPSSVAASGYSNTAMAGHDDDDDQDEGAMPVSRDDESHSLHSRQSSYASRKSLDDDSNSFQSSQSASSMVDNHHDYEQLADVEEERTPLVEHDDRFSSSFGGAESHPGRMSVSDETTLSVAHSSISEYQELEAQAPRATSETLAESPDLDSASDHEFFPNDEATWSEIRSQHRSPSDSIETTGLGIFGARTLSDTREEVREEAVGDLSLEQSGVSLPADDVGEVMDLLNSRTDNSFDPSVNLASPIRLGLSHSDKSSSGRFEAVRGESETVDELSNTRTGLAEDPGRPAPALPHGRADSVSSFRTNAQVSIDIRPPSTVYSSPEFVQQRKQRNGWAAVPPVVDKSLSASSSVASVATLASDARSDSQRASTIGLMENLDDLERALADLTPVSSRKSPVSAQVVDSPTEVPSLPCSSPRLPVSTLSLVEETPATTTGVLEPQEPHETAPVSPGLGSRPVYKYGQSYTSPSATLEQQAVVSVEDAPVVAVTSSLAPAPPTESTGIARPPRSASLRKPVVEPAQVALPPSPMPDQYEDPDQRINTPLDIIPSSQDLQQEIYHIHRRPPPLPIAEEHVPLATGPTQRSPKSPGNAFKSLRPSKSWRKNKDSNDTSKSFVAADVVAEPLPPKSPSFFSKPAFHKLGGMFNKKAATDALPETESVQDRDFATDSSLASPQFMSDSEAGEDHRADQTAGAGAGRDTTPPAVPSKNELANIENQQRERTPSPVDPPEQNASAAQRPTEDQPDPPSLDSIARPSHPDYLERLAPGSPFTASFPQPATFDATSQDMQPSASSDSYQSAASELSGTATPLTPLDGNFESVTSSATPAQMLESAQVYEQDTHSTPKVPASLNPHHSTPSASFDLISSPRSEYDPRTPVQTYATLDSSSAPTTPSNWTKHLDPSSRFGSKLKSKQKINADIDHLLSQMSDIDFGSDESEVQRQSTLVNEEEAVSVKAMPARLAESESAEQPRQESESMASSRQEYPKSMDLSRLGDMMISSPSPPSSPYSGIVSPIASPPLAHP